MASNEGGPSLNDKTYLIVAIASLENRLVLNKFLLTH
jgi:hypothetical protein